jgi:hypothetical protein
MKTPPVFQHRRGKPKSRESQDFGLDNHKSIAVRHEVKVSRDATP